MFIDAHCHINSLAEEKIGDVASACLSGYTFIDSSINFQSTLNSLQLSDKYHFVYSAIGFHPFSVKEFNETVISDYEKVLRSNKKIVAIGEIGLDEFAEVPFKKQEEVFCRFLVLAKQFNLPVMIHNRVSEESLGDSSKPCIFDILDKHFTSYEKIIFHCFSYSKTFLERITEKHGYASFSLNVLRKKKDISESLRVVSLENLLLETDSPYMKIDRRPSSPLDIEAVYSFVATMRNLELQELKEAVYSNAKKLFSLK
jgi:TatD DNase family protein